MQKYRLILTTIISLTIIACQQVDSSNNTKQNLNTNDSIPLTKEVLKDIKIKSQNTLIRNKSVNSKPLIKFYAKFYDDLIENSNSRMMYLIKYENNSPIWLVHPASDFGRKHPHKGIRTSSDSVMINAPYESGIIGYQGLFFDNIARGEHKIFTPEGKVKYIINYDLNVLNEYDSLENIIWKDLNYTQDLTAGSLKQDYGQEYFIKNAEPFNIK